MNTDSLVDVRGMAETLGVPMHVVNYAILRLAIQPVQRAGHIRLYSRETVDRIRVHLRPRY